MSPDHHLWACASWVLNRYGDDASMFVAQRLGEMALRGDGDGVRVWKAIAARLDQLMKAEPRPQ